MQIVHNSMQFEMQHIKLFIWHLSRVMDSNRVDIIKYVACVGFRHLFLFKDVH